jgi:DNA modification methylase
MAKINWTLRTFRLDELTDYYKNPRSLSEKEFKQLKTSLDKFGMIDKPIVNLDSANTIIGGHQRKHVLEASGVKECECWIPDRELTEREVEELNIRLNKNTGSWDFDTLANEFELDDLLEWGFDKGELDLDLWADDAPEDVEPQIDKAEELRVKWGVESGQLWQLGEHRLICGDCTDERNITTVMQGEQANLCFTSPPYWVGKSYETQDSVEAINNFIRSVSVCIDKAVKKDESRIVINTGTGFTTSFDKRQKRQTLLLIDKWSNCFYELKWNLRHVRHWLKHGQLMSIGAKSDMIDQHCEWLATYEADDGKEIDFSDRIDENEVESLLTFYHIGGHSRGRGQESVRNYKDAKKWALSGYWDDIHGNANSDNHCAAFPLELVERHMVLYSKKDEYVYEPFSGSGTTLIACERLGRKCRAVEISPAYVAVAIQRWVDVTGKEPVLLDT